MPEAAIKQEVKDTISEAKDALGEAKSAIIEKAHDEMVPKAKLDEALQRIKSHEQTISALGKAMERGELSPQQAQHQVQQVSNQLDVVIENVARTFSGADKNEVGQWVRFMNVVMGELARPYVAALAQLADRTDLYDARFDIPDFNDFSSEIDKERELRGQRGEYLSRKEAYHLVRSRHIPELLEKEREKLLKERMQGEAGANATATGGSDLGATTEKAGPAPTKRNASYTKEEFANLSLEDKEKLLENASF